MSENHIKLSVYGILTDKGNNVLMHKRSNTRYANGWWSFLGGHVESEESVCAALRRELFEEGGIQVHPDHCSFRLTLVRKPDLGKRYVNFFYVIKEWVGVPTISDGKASLLSFFSPTDLPDPTLPYIREALQLIANGISFHESIY